MTDLPICLACRWHEGGEDVESGPFGETTPSPRSSHFCRLLNRSCEWARGSVGMCGPEGICWNESGILTREQWRARRERPAREAKEAERRANAVRRAMAREERERRQEVAAHWVAEAGERERIRAEWVRLWAARGAWELRELQHTVWLRQYPTVMARHICILEWRAIGRSYREIGEVIGRASQTVRVLEGRAWRARNDWRYRPPYERSGLGRIQEPDGSQRDVWLEYLPSHDPRLDNMVPVRP